ncbi:TPA: hypothetical protein ACJ12F_005237, partial [Klebsiella pneumoniae]
GAEGVQCWYAFKAFKGLKEASHQEEIDGEEGERQQEEIDGEEEERQQEAKRKSAERKCGRRVSAARSSRRRRRAAFLPVSLEG